MVLTHPKGAWVEIHLWGGTVTAWHPSADSENVFWVDPRNSYDASGPIRGGIPLVFPWFGPHGLDGSLPQHGFARITGATVESNRSHSPGNQLFGGLPTRDSVGLSLSWKFTSDQHWPSLSARPLPSCTLGLDMDLGEDWLRVVLAVRNESDRPLDAEMLLHPYFAVGSPLTAEVVGLEGLKYADKNDGGRVQRHGSSAVGLVPAPDHAFEAAGPGPLTLRRPPLPTLVLERLGRCQTVVWNSGPIRGQGPETAPAFACVEPGRVREGALRGLAPGFSDGVGMKLQLDPGKA
jgi:D-hexose-6-phosphate mutarotase